MVPEHRSARASVCGMYAMCANNFF